MLRFVTFRTLRIVPTALAVVTILFFLFQLVPGDPATLLAGATATQAEIETIRRQLGLDDSILVRYGRYVLGLLAGDLGYSTTFQESPLPFILERLPATFALMAAAMALTVGIGLPAGILAAVFRNTPVDYAISLTVVALLAVPNFWLGLILLSWLSVELGALPSFGFTGFASLIMPSIALAARLIALVARMTRAVLLEELRKDYIRTARAKGLGGFVVVWRHALRNALIPTVTVIGLQTGYLLGGSVVIERLFAWPGIGDLMINALGARDYTLVQGITLLYVAGFLVVNLIVDLLYVAINPRLRRT